MKMEKKKKPSVGFDHHGKERAATVKVIKVVLLNRDANDLYSQ